MNSEQLAVKLQETADRSLRNEGRIEKLEGEHEVLQQLVTSVAVMAEQMKNMKNQIEALLCTINSLSLISRQKSLTATTPPGYFL